MKTKNIWKINAIAAAMFVGGIALPAAAETTATLEAVSYTHLTLPTTPYV